MQRYFAKERKDNVFYLEDKDIYHIKTVMRMKENDKVEVVYDRQVYICNIDKDYNINLDRILDHNNEINKEIIIAVGLVKEQKMDLILQKLTELGVSKIIPVNMERSIVKLDKAKETKKLDRWNSICKEASEQSKRNIIPKVSNIINIKDLPNIDADLRLVCSTSEKDNLIHNVLNNNYNSILLVIGPEGGITPSEEEYLVNNNFTKVSFGNLVLRVETACIYVASILNYLTTKK